MKPNYKAESLITGSMLESMMRYEPEIGNFYAASTRGGILAGSILGSKRLDGYIQLKINGRAFLAHRLAHVWMTGRWPDKEIDHKDRTRSNNRYKNLRPADHFQNTRNATIKKNNKSGYSGVFWLVRKDGRAPRWEASIRANGKKVRLGFFRFKKDAVAARQAAEIKFFGNFSRSA